MNKLSLLRKQPIQCKVEVMTKDGGSHAYSGLFKSTTDAVMDALNRFGMGNKISVRRMA